ncbi:MAG: acyl-CoA desaturase [Acidobacteriota bacterium]
MTDNRQVERVRTFLISITRWFDSWAGVEDGQAHEEQRVDWIRSIPFFAMHMMCLAIIWVGWSWIAVAVAAALYAFRMFFVTAFYHRYFSHRTFKTSRGGQFLFGILGSTCAQKGPLWWAAHHRDHHRHSDQQGDVHSPHEHGLWWSHMGWITAKSNFPTKLKNVPDLARFPELRFLDRYDIVVPAAMCSGLFTTGALLEAFAPGLGTSGMQMLVWGFFVSTTVLFHAVCTINSLAHKLGKKRFHTKDESRNSLALALLTFGEGWHNNHHHFPASTRQGFYWWEVDLTYYFLKMLSWTGLIWDLRPVPDSVKVKNRIAQKMAA